MDSGHYYVCHSFLPASVPEWTQWMGMGVRGDEGEKALYLDTAPYSRKGKNSPNVLYTQPFLKKSSSVRTYNWTIVISYCTFFSKKKKIKLNPLPLVAKGGEVLICSRTHRGRRNEEKEGETFAAWLHGHTHRVIYAIGTPTLVH